MSFEGVNYKNFQDVHLGHPFRTKSGYVGYFDPDTLLMTGWVNCQGFMVARGYQKDGVPFIGISGPLEAQDFMVDPVAMTFVERPDMGVELAGGILSGVPLDAALSVNGTYHAVTDSTIKLEAPPGKVLHITVEKHPYKTFRGAYASPEL